MYITLMILSEIEICLLTQIIVNKGRFFTKEKCHVEIIEMRALGCLVEIGGNKMKFEYLALIGAAIFISNAMGDLLTEVTCLTIGDICVALAIICSYIDVFIKQLQPYKKYLMKFAGVLACMGIISYIKNFM